MDRWTVAPASRCYVQPAVFLPGQIERIERTEFAPLDVVIQGLKGDFEVEEEATVALRLRDVDLFDGVLYAGGAVRHLRRRERRSPMHFRLEEVAEAALFETYLGNRWFGNWLAEDCITYPLAAAQGSPVTSLVTPHGRHCAEYEALTRMPARRLSAAHFDALVLIEDRPNNAGKAQRVAAFRDALIGGRKVERHAGTFLLRGHTGDRRVLENERELAEDLAHRRGFKVVDPIAVGVDALVAACAGAEVIAGVEGSHLIHGIMAMPADAHLFVVQPPRRVTTALKLFTDRVGQGYAFAVAEGGDREFRVSLADVHRTLDACRR